MNCFFFIGDASLSPYSATKTAKFPSYVVSEIAPCHIKNIRRHISKAKLNAK